MIGCVKQDTSGMRDVIEVDAVGQWLDPELRKGAEESFVYQMLIEMRDEVTEVDLGETLVKLWNEHEMGATIREVSGGDQPLVDELNEANAELASAKAELADLRIDLQNLKNQHYALRRACEASKAAKIVQALACLPERKYYR